MPPMVWRHHFISIKHNKPATEQNQPDNKMLMSLLLWNGTDNGRIKPPRTMSVIGVEFDARNILPGILGFTNTVLPGRGVTAKGITLTGSLPLELILLHDSLTRLSLAGNMFWNQGPSHVEFLGQLTKLTHLDLSQNAGLVYDGGIPTQFAALTNLEHLDLSYTNRSGPLDANAVEIFQSWSPNLSKLLLDGLDRLRNAELLFDILPTFPNLHHLGLSDIPFESELRMKLEDMPQLTTLDLRNAHLTGGLDTFLDSSNSSDYPTLLRTLRLDHNHNLGGTIPTIVGGLLTSLNYWEMSYCNFTGPVPSQITFMRHIRMLLWNNNALHGPLPQNMSALKSMNSLNLQ